MANQDWKHGRLNRSLYTILKPCPECGGTGKVCGCGARGLADCICVVGRDCQACNGLGAVKPKDPKAAYFVLRIDCNPATGEPWDPHAHLALWTYCWSVEKENPTFAAGIKNWLAELRAAAVRPADQSSAGPESEK